VDVTEQEDGIFQNDGVTSSLVIPNEVHEHMPFGMIHDAKSKEESTAAYYCDEFDSCILNLLQKDHC
jgi:hypothetical protein